MRRLLIAFAVAFGCAGVVLAEETTLEDDPLREAAGHLRMTSVKPMAASRLADGDAVLREARTRVDRNIGDDEALANLADTLRELAVRTPTRADALGEIGESLSIREGLMDRQERDASWIRTLADDYGFYGSRLAAAGEHATAIGAYSRRLTILASLREAAVREGPSAADLAWQHLELAEEARGMGESALAAREDRLALAAFRDQLRTDYQSAEPGARAPQTLHRISSSHDAVAGILLRAGDVQAAVAEHFSGIAVFTGKAAAPDAGGRFQCGHYRSIERIYAGAGDRSKAGAADSLAAGVCAAP
ncbi:MAG: hypothetical protein AB7I79_04990 [Rhizobiaceae bacterium]